MSPMDCAGVVGYHNCMGPFCEASDCFVVDDDVRRFQFDERNVVWRVLNGGGEGDGVPCGDLCVVCD